MEAGCWALSEFHIEGVRSTFPAHLAPLSEPAFIEATHSTTWLEDEVDPALLASAAAASSPVRRVPTRRPSWPAPCPSRWTGAAST